ncbi:FAD-binding and (Fe-S)-binding domain-containing protein [Candidatus Formimonas warabiya]|uniref:Disulfide reductase n=1 Tax=Formimonas warabiya TaxID=1761012 RepID=A0A3G1KVG7_FORW1|nr:FAD-binding and (Fe-S)-binding domain-containing protein [Candidatus Formimonas warabiya]ATW26513.1 disulfide reductase [Candidatus Formimonas warabiya]
MAHLSSEIREQLKARWENRINFDELERKIYARDMGVMPSMIKPLVGNPVPEGIVQPVSEAELIELVNMAREEKINLVPRGKATSGYGGVLPVHQGLVVEFNRMKQIHPIHAEDQTVTVEPGAVWEEVEFHLNQHGLTLALYPTSALSSTVGGWLAQGGAGIGSFEYGYFRENVVSARLVLGDGSVQEMKGQDLDLVSDVNGITGLISQVTFRVKPLTQLHIKAIAFDDCRNLASFMKEIYDRKVPLWSVSFINQDAARLKNQLPPHLHHGHPVVDAHKVMLPEKYIALLSCTHDRCDVVTENVLALAAAHHGQVLGEEIARHEWEARFEPIRAKRIAPSLIPSEVVVPVETLGEVIEEIARDIKHPFILEGFATNKREFVLLGFILHDERKIYFNLAYGLSLSILKTAQKFGGRPYATGLYFTGFAHQVLGEDRVQRLRDFKSRTDLQGIMNPGKVLDSSLVSAGIGVAGLFEPIVKVFGNWAKTKEPGEVFQDRKGIPGDVAWYAYACSQCGYCVDHCDQYYGRGWESQSPRGKWTYLKMVLEGEAAFNQKTVDTFLACTTCEMCNKTCQLDLPNESSWLKLRGMLVQKRGYRTFPPFEIMANSLRRNGNIWGSYAKDRDQWMTDEIRTVVKEKADYAFFPGCTASYVEHDVAQSVAHLLKASGIEFAYLGKEERCCAIPMLVSGRWEVFDETAAKNIENMKKTGAHTVVTACPACWLVWEVYYRQWAEERGVEYPFHAKHYADVLAERIKAGALTLPNNVERKVTYHDPCHMGRAGGRYEGPRTLIQAIPGSHFREMRFHKEKAHCCGSVLSLVADPDIAADIGAVRLQEALECGADTVITACPCCRVQLKNSADVKGVPIQVRDLATLAAESLGCRIPDSDPVIDEKWAVFDGMIRMMTPWGMAEMMAEMIPDMIEAMPDLYRRMMRMVIASPPVMKEPMIGMMKRVMPSLFPSLLPGMMPKIMPAMLEKVAQAVPMPEYLLEQMPDLMPKTMEVLMPKMLKEIIPHFMPKMVEYLKTAS